MDTEFHTTRHPKAEKYQAIYGNRLKRQFVGKAEGRAGEDPASFLGKGNRELLKSIEKVTVFGGGKRKTRIHEMIDSGQSSEALRRLLRHQVRSSPESLRKLSAVDFPDGVIATQSGLSRIAKTNFKDKVGQGRRMDAISV